MAPPTGGWPEGDGGADPGQPRYRHGQADIARVRGIVAPALSVDSILGLDDHADLAYASAARTHRRGGPPGGGQDGGVLGRRKAPKRKRAGWLSREGRRRRGR